MDSGESNSNKIDGWLKIEMLHTARDGAGGGEAFALPRRVEGVNPTIKLLSHVSLCINSARVLLLSSI